jgi:predicted acyl esterase
MTDADLREIPVEVRDGMRISWDVPISMTDGTVLRADIFLPEGDGSWPVVMSYGCYAKGLAFQEAYAAQWDRMTTDFPEIMEGTSNKYQCWEVVDPERWVPNGYAVVRVDSRGAGRSEGVHDVWSMQEVWDYYECIEWAGEKSWSTGDVGLLGISYYGANQWLVASLQPITVVSATGSSIFGCRSSSRCSTAMGIGVGAARTPESWWPGPRPCRMPSLSRIGSTRCRRCGRTRWPTSTTRVSRRTGRS